MLNHLLLLTPISYSIFVFTSRFYNPFATTNGPLKKRRLRFGRMLALVSFIVGAVGMAMIDIYNQPFGSTLSTCLILFVLLLLPSVIKHWKNPLWN